MIYDRTEERHSPKSGTRESAISHWELVGDHATRGAQRPITSESLVAHGGPQRTGEFGKSRSRWICSINLRRGESGILKIPTNYDFSSTLKSRTRNPEIGKSKYPIGGYFDPYYSRAQKTYSFGNPGFPTGGAMWSGGSVNLGCDGSAL